MKDHITVMLGNLNFSASAALPPEKPQIHPLPVIWTKNQCAAAWVTSEMFEGWYAKDFMMVLEEYFESKDIHFFYLLPQ